MSKVTTKVDIFSFGIIVMEFLTKQRPTELAEEEGISTSLRQLVEKALENGINIHLQALDPMLALNFSKEQEEILVKLFKLALFCTNTNPEDRPNIKDVLSTLQKINAVH